MFNLHPPRKVSATQKQLCATARARHANSADGQPSSYAQGASFVDQRIRPRLPKRLKKSVGANESCFLKTRSLPTLPGSWSRPAAASGVRTAWIAHGGRQRVSAQVSGEGGRRDCRQRLPGAGLKVRVNRNLYSRSGPSLLIVNRRSGELPRIPRKTFGSHSAALRTGSAVVQQPL